MAQTVADHPHARFEQAQDIASAVLHGDEKVRQYLPVTKGDD